MKKVTYNSPLSLVIYRMCLGMTSGFRAILDDIFFICGQPLDINGGDEVQLKGKELVEMKTSDTPSLLSQISALCNC